MAVRKEIENNSGSNHGVPRTPFGRSFLILLIMVGVPLITWYFLTSPEIIAPSSLPFNRALAIGMSFAIGSAVILTSHLVLLIPTIESDQLIYHYGFYFLINSLYVSGWYWPGSGRYHWLIRGGITIGMIVIGLFIGTIDSMWWRKLSNWWAKTRN